MNTEQPFTPRLKKVLAVATKQAKDHGHSWTGCEHVLIGILLEEGNHAAKWLSDFGVTKEEMSSRLSAAFPPVNTDQSIGNRMKIVMLQHELNRIYCEMERLKASL